MRFLAETDATAWLVALGTLVGTLITAAVGGYVLWLAARDKEKENARIGKAADRKDALSEWQGIVADLRSEVVQLREQIERHESAAKKWQDLVQCLAEERTRCMTAIHFLYQHTEQMHTQLVQAGRDPGPMPKLPEDWSEEPQSEKMLREAVHSTELLRRANETIKAPVPPPPTGGAS